MVVVVPVDGQINEAQHIADQVGRQRAERRPIGAVRHLQIQHHDGDDDGDDAIAERSKTIFAHSGHFLLAVV
jgi:hypothetical protein